MGNALLESTRLLANSMRVLADKTVVGLEINKERAKALAESSPSIVTPLNKYIGYEAAAKIAKHSVANGMTVREATIALGYVDGEKLTMEQLDAAPTPEYIRQLKSIVVSTGYVQQIREVAFDRLYRLDLADVQRRAAGHRVQQVAQGGDGAVVHQLGVLLVLPVLRA